MRNDGSNPVAVSADARLRSAAIRAALDAPEVRLDAVERGRQALAAGTLSRDVHRLADRILDRLLGD